MSWHKWLHSMCSKFHIAFLSYKVDTTLFKSSMIWVPHVVSFVGKTHSEVFIDVGACYGRYIILLGKRYKQLIAIEPHPQNMQIIKSNVECAGLTNVRFIQCAVSDQDGYADLYLGSRDDWHSLDGGRDKEKVNVKTLTLASILSGYWVDLVKVDVEGAEWVVLKGAEPILERIRSWIVELHNLERKVELEKWFISRGYSVKWFKLGDKISKHLYAWRAK